MNKFMLTFFGIWVAAHASSVVAGCDNLTTVVELGEMSACNYRSRVKMACTNADGSPGTDLYLELVHEVSNTSVYTQEWWNHVATFDYELEDSYSNAAWPRHCFTTSANFYAEDVNTSEVYWDTQESVAWCNDNCCSGGNLCT